MTYLTQFGTATTANTNLNTTTLIGTFTNNTRIRKLYLNIFADQVKGNGDYKASITIQRAGAGSFYQSIITTNTAAAGVTSILFNSIAVTLNATDVMKVYLLGLSTDNDTTADVIVDVNEEWINTDASGNITVGDYASGKVPLQPTVAGRTVDVAASGEVESNVTQIDGAATNGYNATLKLKQLDIQSGSGDLPAVHIVGNGDGAGMDIQGGSTFGQGILVQGGGLAAGLTVIGGSGNADGADIIGGGTTGYGMAISAAATDGIGLLLNGSGTRAGLMINQVATGPGLLVTTTDGDGVVVTPGGAGHYDINADIHGTVDGLDTLIDTLMGVGWTTETLVALQAAINSRLAAASYTTPPTAIAISDQVWDEAIAGHLAAGSTGLALNTAGAAADPLTNPVPGTYASGTAGSAIGSLLTGKITVTSPMAQDGLAVKLVRGDDYLNADGRALVWTDSGSQWPNLTGATVRFKWGIFTKNCTVIGAGGVHQQVSLDLTSAETNVLENGTFDLEATLSNTHVVTIVIAGSLIIREDV